MSENACISGVATSADAGQSNEAIARAERSAALATLAITREEERSERENDEKRQWKYDTFSVIKSLASHVCELKDGRWCCAYLFSLYIWNMDSSAREMTMEGHTNNINQVIQLRDDRVCSCSNDKTIKLWNIDSGICELTLTVHTDHVTHIIQLSDGRVCSGSWDRSVRVWNTLTGVCEMTIKTQRRINSIAQLADGRICCGDNGGRISIHSLMTGECELSWKGHTKYVYAIVCIDAIRICSGSDDKTIKIWSIATGECERTLVGHTDSVLSMVLMQDGRLCSASYDRTLRLWNLKTGECEKTMMCTLTDGVFVPVVQLNDGRFALIVHSKGIRY